jgi:hypothetical protein
MIIDVINSKVKIEDLSPEEFILHKISVRESEVKKLKEDYFKLTGKMVEDVTAADDNSAKTFNMPSKKEFLLNINKFLLEANGNVFKTREIFDKFHANITEKEEREEYVRRYSALLNNMKKTGILYSKNVEGERGSVYSTDISKIEK